MFAKTRYMLFGLVAMSGIFGTVEASGITADVRTISAYTTLTLTAADEFQLEPVHQRRYRHRHKYRGYRYGYRPYIYNRDYRPYRSYRYRYRYGRYYPRSSYYY